VSDSGAIVERDDYDAFGKRLQSGASNTIWQQDDCAYDSASGWTYHLARWRDGFRFTGRDTIIVHSGDSINSNLYLHAGANSLHLGDPSGHFSLAQVLTVTGVAAAQAA